MGWENLFHCEINSFAQQILKHYWPHAKTFTDVTATDFRAFRGKIDILTGGFPCQPYSQAGKRLGKEDDRHLWPEMLRAIREIQPRWVVGENVFGLINWNDGMVFDEVQAELEAEGYTVQPYVLPACAVNAPHRRDRVWFIAYTESQRGSRLQKRTKEAYAEHGKYGNDGYAAHTQRERSPREEYRQAESGQYSKENSGYGWQDFPTQPPICSGNDGFSSRLSGITFPKWRNESIKAAGNAIVPQVALQIFKSIQKYEQSNRTIRRDSFGDNQE